MHHCEFYLYKFSFRLSLPRHHVSVPFHQTVRATSPAFTACLYTISSNNVYPLRTYLTLIPNVLGVAVYTYGDFTYTSYGIFLTFFGSFLAALKTILTNYMLTKDNCTSSYEFLLHISPLAFLQSMMCAWLNGEIAVLTKNIRQLPQNANVQYTNMSRSFWFSILTVLGNGLLSFFLNVSSFETNRVAGALSIAVFANVKQCLTIALSKILFGESTTSVALVGLSTTMASGCVFSYFEIAGRRHEAVPETSKIQKRSDGLGQVKKNMQ